MPRKSIGTPTPSRRTQPTPLSLPSNPSTSTNPSPAHPPPLSHSQTAPVSLSYNSNASSSSRPNPNRSSLSLAPGSFPSTDASSGGETSSATTTSKCSSKRHRLRKKSKVAGAYQPGGSSEDEDEGGRTMRISTDISLASGPSSPRQLIARGIGSIQKRLSSASRPRSFNSNPIATSSTVDLAALPSSFSPSLPLPSCSQPIQTASSKTFRPLSNYFSSSSSHLPSKPNLSPNAFPNQRPEPINFHLPTRISNPSSLSTLKLKPKQPSPTAHMPPPSLPSSHASRRPSPSHSTSFPVSEASPTAPHTTNRSPIHPHENARITSLSKKHRPSASVNSIPIPNLHSSTISTDAAPRSTESPSPPDTLATMAHPPPLPASSSHAHAPDHSRSTSVPSVQGNVARRNSLNDLRIPSRVASAQKALREKVGVVREFAVRVEGKPFLLPLSLRSR
jgi:hypothetical protein